MIQLNPFTTNVPLLYPMKTENRRSSDIFREYKRGKLVENGLINPINSCNKVYYQ